MDKIFRNPLIIYERIQPSNTCRLGYIYQYLLSSCPDYSELTMKDFMKCKNSIYIARATIDNTIYGIIGVREGTMEEFGIDELDFYSMPDRHLYSIDFLHALSTSKTDILGNYIDYIGIQIKLIREALVDKNNGFAVLCMKCPTGKTPNSHDALIDYGFKIYSYDKKTEMYTYICPPKMHLNE